MESYQKIFRGLCPPTIDPQAVKKLRTDGMGATAIAERLKINRTPIIGYSPDPSRVPPMASGSGVGRESAALFERGVSCPKDVAAMTQNWLVGGRNATSSLAQPKNSSHL